MIWESGPWKEEIARIAVSLKKRKGQKRWYEPSYVNFEKEIFFAAYFIRKLQEAHKISDEIKTHTIKASEFKPTKRPVDIMNRYKIEELYNLSNPSGCSLSLMEFCNQIIHSFVFIPSFIDPPLRLDGFFVTSDRKKEISLFHFKIDNVIELLLKISNDCIVYCKMLRDKKTKQIKVVKNSSILDNHTKNFISSINSRHHKSGE
ncbi:hypothetical protein [Dethiosulfatarculus sandiegensis]|uniref:Uncharacterized protein n=1 Tax=Dethiosulfatarculus sandiegensis TaxID=1429043 RepID=A0A0D2GN23_9BACT|nr:hypothetical protein [Dethiosulfatarculus sandiegensis]KIX16002.1 hypothetical protein X474_00015 [Dethiosulfatarculus sandiegensis]